MCVSLQISIPAAQPSNVPPVILLNPSPALSAGDFEKMWRSMQTVWANKCLRNANFISCNSSCGNGDFCVVKLNPQTLDVRNVHSAKPLYPVIIIMLISMLAQLTARWYTLSSHKSVVLHKLTNCDWFSSQEVKVRLRCVPPPKALEKALAARFIMTMASSSPDQPNLQFFFFAKHVSRVSGSWEYRGTYDDTV